VGPPRDLRFDETELQRAVARDELLLHYQPIVAVRSRHCQRVEALLRWKHPRLGLLLPRDFMPSATSSALRDAIGQWVLGAAVRQWLEWQKQGEALSVSINLFGPELARVESLIVAFREVHSGGITFELTPGVLSSGDPVVSDAIVRLAAAGARIALDDVSAEDAPTRALGAAIDEIKISRSLVQRAPSDQRARSDLRALVELARDYRLSCVSVGIEDAAALDLVSSIGCDYAQGYWVSRPLVPDRLAPARRWALGLAFSGAMAFTSQAGAARAGATAGGVIETPMLAGGFLSSACCLELPTLSAQSKGSETGVTLDQLRQRTGHVFTSQAVRNAVIFSEDSVTPAQRQAVARAVDRDMQELEQEFGRTFDARPSIYLFSTRASFALGLQQVFGVRGPDAGLLAAANGGVNLSRQGAIVINLQNLRNDKDLAIVRHELTHALVHEIIGPEAVLPAWFEEGLATLEERKDALSATEAVRHAAVALSLVTEEKAMLGDLEHVSQWVQRNAALDGHAYTVSAEAVRLVEESVSRAGIVRMLEATGRDISFADAFASETGQSVAEFERAFPARLAADQKARIAQTPVADGVRWTLAGFTPQSAVTISIDGAGYHLEYEITTDTYGMYQAVFGATAPPGEYTIRASRGGSDASMRIRT